MPRQFFEDRVELSENAEFLLSKMCEAANATQRRIAGLARRRNVAPDEKSMAIGWAESNGMFATHRGRRLDWEMSKDMKRAVLKSAMGIRSTDLGGAKYRQKCFAELAGKVAVKIGHDRRDLSEARELLKRLSDVPAGFGKPAVAAQPTAAKMLFPPKAAKPTRKQKRAAEVEASRLAGMAVGESQASRDMAALVEKIARLELAIAMKSKREAALREKALRASSEIADGSYGRVQGGKRRQARIARAAEAMAASGRSWERGRSRIAVLSAKGKTLAKDAKSPVGPRQAPESSCSTKPSKSQMKRDGLARAIVEIRRLRSAAAERRNEFEAALEDWRSSRDMGWLFEGDSNAGGANRFCKLRTIKEEGKPDRRELDIRLMGRLVRWRLLREAGVSEFKKLVRGPKADLDKALLRRHWLSIPICLESRTRHDPKAGPESKSSSSKRERGVALLGAIEKLTDAELDQALRDEIEQKTAWKAIKEAKRAEWLAKNQGKTTADFPKFLQGEVEVPVFMPAAERYAKNPSGKRHAAVSWRLAMIPKKIGHSACKNAGGSKFKTWLRAEWDDGLSELSTYREGGCLGIDINAWGVAFAACSADGNFRRKLSGGSAACRARYAKSDKAREKGKGKPGKKARASKVKQERERDQSLANEIIDDAIPGWDGVHMYGRMEIDWKDAGSDACLHMCRVAAFRLASLAKFLGRPLALEALDFEDLKKNLRYESAGRARQLSGFAYAALVSAIAAACGKLGVELIWVDAKWTSVAGFAKYGYAKQLDADESAALAVARKAILSKATGDFVVRKANGGFVKAASRQEKAEGLFDAPGCLLARLDAEEAATSAKTIRKSEAKPSRKKKTGALLAPAGPLAAHDEASRENDSTRAEPPVEAGARAGESLVDKVDPWRRISQAMGRDRKRWGVPLGLAVSAMKVARGRSARSAKARSCARESENPAGGRTSVVGCAVGRNISTV